MFVVGKDTVIFNEVGQMVVRVTDPVIARNVQALPYVQILHSENQMLAMLPWNEDACKLFQNAGLDMAGAAPLWHTNLPLIEGQYKPMQHQLFTAAFLTLNPRCYILSDPRTGKTGAFILGMDYMQRHRMITGGVLIISTVTTLHGVWHDSIKTTLPHSIIEIAHGKNRATALERPAEFYITNYDSVRIAKKEFVRAAKEGRIGAIGIDEMTHIGNPSSQRHKAIDELCNKCGVPIIVGLTGSPGENAETVFGMARMVNRHKLPCTTKNSWLDLVTYQYGPEHFMRRMSPRAPQIIHEALQPAVRFNKKDIIDLPPVTIQDRECNLSQEQIKIREQFKQQALALLESGVVITAANGGVNHQKLMQVAQGFTIGNSGEIHYLDYKDRLETIVDCVKETNRKVVIFAIYRAILERLETDFKKRGYTTALIHGGTPASERSRLLHDFQNKKDPHLIFMNVVTSAFGIELSAADTIIYAGCPQVGGTLYTQSLERVSSKKQTSDKINIIRIVSSPEEKKAYAALDSGKKMGQIVNELFEDITRGVI